MTTDKPENIPQKSAPEDSHKEIPVTQATSVEPDEDSETLDFGGFPDDAPDMKRFLGCGG